MKLPGARVRAGLLVGARARGRPCVRPGAGGGARRRRLLAIPITAPLIHRLGADRPERERRGLTSARRWIGGVGGAAAAQGDPAPANCRRDEPRGTRDAALSPPSREGHRPGRGEQGTPQPPPRPACRGSDRRRGSVSPPPTPRPSPPRTAEEREPETLLSGPVARTVLPGQPQGGSVGRSPSAASPAAPPPAPPSAPRSPRGHRRGRRSLVPRSPEAKETPGLTSEDTGAGSCSGGGLRRGGTQRGGACAPRWASSGPGWEAAARCHAAATRHSAPLSSEASPAACHAACSRVSAQLNHRRIWERRCKTTRLR